MGTACHTALGWWNLSCLRAILAATANETGRGCLCTSPIACEHRQQSLAACFDPLVTLFCWMLDCLFLPFVVSIRSSRGDPPRRSIAQPSTRCSAYLRYFKNLLKGSMGHEAAASLAESSPALIHWAAFRGGPFAAAQPALRPPVCGIIKLCATGQLGAW